jgi:hypothetical protein
MAQTTMTAETIRRLAWCEYDFAQIDAALTDLRTKLRLCQSEAPRCKAACKQLNTIRRMFRGCLAGLDESISEAVCLAEGLPGAPF